MILGVGTDILHISRIQDSFAKFGNDFLNRVMSKEELGHYDFVGKEYNDFTDKNWAKVAKIFSIKEAVSKAIGTGIAKGVSFKDMTLLNDDFGKPFVKIDGKSLEVLKQSAITKFKRFSLDDFGFEIEISISDEKDLVQTFAIIDVFKK
ncbi:MAG: holo-ACP synthase [Alphaproteobacteria bacterium]|jgi:holo-[acyl-carrier protein] synthase|nr:holo-ACP synthase [Alphaproteobacteria bacterium]